MLQLREMILPDTVTQKAISIKKWFLRNPVMVTLGLSILLLSYTLIKVAQYRSFNSDDVSWQTILLSWQPFSDSTVTLGLANIYVDKLPIFLIFDQIFKPSLQTLVAEAVIFSIVSFVLYFFAAVYFLKKSGVKLSYTTLLPIIWVATLGFSFAQLSLSPMWRGLETGFTFFAFMLVAMLYFGDIKVRSWWSKLLVLILLFIGGLLAYSDPYWLYFTAGPIILFAIILFSFKKLSPGQLLWIAGGSAAIVLFAKLSATITHFAGISVSGDYPAQFVDFTSLPSNIMTTIHGLLIMFDANFFGRLIELRPSLIVTFLNALVLILIALVTYSGVKLLPKKHSTPAHITQIFFSLFALLVAVAYSTSTLASVHTHRYLYILAFSSGIVLSWWIGTAKNKPVKYFFISILAITIIGNLAVTTRGVPGYIQVGNLGNNIGNSVNQEVIATVKKAGLTKGYANYWNSHINTYLAGGDIDFLSSICQDGKSHLFPWLANNDRYSQPASRSFFLVDPNIPYVPTCSESELITQLGPPERTIELSGSRRLLIWSYDITSRM